MPYKRYLEITLWCTHTADAVGEHLAQIILWSFGPLDSASLRNLPLPGMYLRTDSGTMSMMMYMRRCAGDTDFGA